LRYDSSAFNFKCDINWCAVSKLSAMLVKCYKIQNCLLRRFLNFNMFFKPSKLSDGSYFNINRMMISLVKRIFHNDSCDSNLNWLQNSRSRYLGYSLIKDRPLIIARATNSREMPNLPKVVFIRRISQKR
jgi:hypothetical protein